MSVLGSLEKEPAEKFPVTVNFTRDLATGETVSSCVVTARNARTGAATTGAVCSGSAQVVTPNVSQTIFAGTDGDTHILTFTATSSLSNIYEHEVSVDVVAH
jgi:hypothetical protein